MLEQHSIEIEGSQVFYWVRNPQLPSTIVFIHGFKGDHIGLTDLSHIEGHRVILIDLPGYGLSQPMRRTHSLRNYARIINLLLNRLDIKKPHIVGHSYGGSIALLYAALYPQHVNKLILLMPAVSQNSISRSLVRLELKINRILPETLQKIWLWSPPLEIASFLIMAKMMSRRRRLEIAEYNLQHPKHYQVRVITESLLSFQRTPFLTYASKIQAPTLILGGEKDFIAPPAMMETLANRIPQAQFHIIPQTGHIANLEVPGTLEALINEFVEPVTSTAHTLIMPAPLQDTTNERQPL